MVRLQALQIMQTPIAPLVDEDATLMMKIGAVETLDLEDSSQSDRRTLIKLPKQMLVGTLQRAP